MGGFANTEMGAIEVKHREKETADSTVEQYQATN